MSWNQPGDLPQPPTPRWARSLPALHCRNGRPPMPSSLARNQTSLGPGGGARHAQESSAHVPGGSGALVRAVHRGRPPLRGSPR